MTRKYSPRRAGVPVMISADTFLRETFEFEYCAECGRDHRHHTAVPFMGNWFARCDLEPVMTADGGDIVVNPEGYPEP